MGMQNHSIQEEFIAGFRGVCAARGLSIVPVLTYQSFDWLLTFLQFSSVKFKLFI